LKKNKNLLSVCIPCDFRSRNLIFNAINDSGRLKRKINFLIFLDGEKKLYSKFFIRKLKRKFPYTKILFNNKKINSGVSVARNKLLEQVKTAYIAFVDADDKFLINKKLISILEKANKNYYELIIFNHLVNKKKSYNYNFSGELQGGRTDILRLVKKHLKFPKGNSIMTHCWAKIYSINYLKKNKIRFDENLKVLEDYLFVANVFKNLKRLFISRSIMYHHFVYEYQSYKTALRHILFFDNYKKPIKIFSKLIRPNKLSKYYYNLAEKYWKIKLEKIINVI
jgi:glycosyltransferase involved in cell wall biosynthesis